MSSSTADIPQTRIRLFSKRDAKLRTEFGISVDVDGCLDAAIDALRVPDSALTWSRLRSYYMRSLAADVTRTTSWRTSVASLRTETSRLIDRTTSLKNDSREHIYVQKRFLLIVLDRYLY